MGIITISREFGSGGRELGKRLADALGYGYFDREIVTKIAENTKCDEEYVARSLEHGNFGFIPITFGRTFSYPAYAPTDAVNLFSEQHKILKEIASKGNCVIVGRASDTVLKDFNPINIFVYANRESKIARCRERGNVDCDVSEKEIEKSIKKIDSQRAKYHELFSDSPWGDKSGYHLCINTSGIEIKKIVPFVCEYVKELMK